MRLAVPSRRRITSAEARNHWYGPFCSFSRYSTLNFVVLVLSATVSKSSVITRSLSSGCRSSDHASSWFGKSRASWYPRICRKAWLQLARTIRPVSSHSKIHGAEWMVSWTSIRSSYAQFTCTDSTQSGLPSASTVSSL